MLGHAVSKAPFSCDILRFHDLPSWKMVCDAPVVPSAPPGQFYLRTSSWGLNPAPQKERMRRFRLGRKTGHGRRCSRCHSRDLECHCSNRPSFLWSVASFSLLLLFSTFLEGAAPSLAASSPGSSSTPASSKLNEGPQLFNSQGFPVEN